MSPRTASAIHRTSAAPYPRRASAQPKSTRQQFSACGACRMRRVRCDLKDLPSPTSGAIQHPSCSNCKERNIKCVDEFAEVKAVKLLRRGRRLQQVEAVYGKVDDDSSPPAPKQSVVPQLKLEFFNSTFFRRFCVQRPVIEPAAFMARYVAHLKGTSPLGIEGRMLAMLLVTWAASFGIDERGVEIDDDQDAAASSPKFARDNGDELSDPKRRVRTLRTEAMTREILTLVDTHAILRRPTWDGVGVLLLLLPLTEGIQSSIERRTTYEATLSQIYSLCNLANPSAMSSVHGALCDVHACARIFWYAYAHEGITTGLRGGRLFFDNDDLVSFQNALLPHCSAAVSSSSPPAEPSLPSPTCSSPVTPDLSLQDLRSTPAFQVAKDYFSLAIGVSSVSRAVHAHLTGPRARRFAEAGIPVREDVMMNIWDSLSRCWDDFQALRHDAGATVGGGLVRGEDVERFVSGWQVFIFECLNIIREALKQRVEAQTSSNSTNGRVTPSDRAVAVNLHAYAVRRCRVFLPRVIDILKRHLAVPLSGFFAHDAGLIRDGCFFAGLLLAQSDLDGDMDMDIQCDDGTRWDSDAEEGVDVCLRALGEISWVYANSHEREKSLRVVWEARIHRDNERVHKHGRDFVGGRSSPLQYPASQDHSPYVVDKTPLPRISHGGPLSLVSAGGQVRPHLPPLSVTFLRGEGGPDTALTDDGAGSWATYSPPTTSGSMTSTVATQRSSSPASPPPLSALPVLKHAHHAHAHAHTQHTQAHAHTHALLTPKTEESCYVSLHDMDPFSFSVDGAATSPGGVVGPGLGAHTAAAGAWPPFSHHHASVGAGAGGGYLDPSVIFPSSDPVLGRMSDDGCPHFGSDCQGFYH